MTLQMDFLGLLGARGAKLAVGLAAMFVYARMFGVSATYDAWVWALGVVNAVGLIVFGPITETLRASYTAIDHREGRPVAEQYLATAAVLMIGGAVVMTLAIAAVLPTVEMMFASDHPDQASAAKFFLYVLAPSVVITQLIAVVTAHLNCHGRVFAPEIAGLVGGAVGVLFIVAFPRLPAVWLLPGSYYIGLVAPLLVGVPSWRGLYRSLRRLEPSTFFRHGRDALAFSLPLLLPYALGQANGLVERQFAFEAGTGALAVLSYAFFARNTTQAVFTAALSALAVPAMARAWDAEDRRPFRDALRHWTHQCLMLVTLGMIVLFGLSDLAPAILFGTKVGPEPQRLLGELLRYYAVAIIAVVMYLVGGSALLAARKGKTYALLGALASLVLMLLLITLFPFIGVVAIPVSLLLGLPVVAWMMFNSVDRADAAWLVKQALMRAVVVVGAGWLVRLADALAQGATVAFAGRLMIGLSIAGASCAVWWIIDHRIAPSPPRALAETGT